MIVKLAIYHYNNFLIHGEFHKASWLEEMTRVDWLEGQW